MSGGIAADRLRAFVERIERLEHEKRAIAEDIKEVYAEAKGNGFDTKTMRAIVKLRRMSLGEREEQEALLDIYKAALGMLADTALGTAALKRLTKKPEDAPKPGPDEKPEEAGVPDLPALSAARPTASAKPPVTIEEAREQGAQAARDGKPVIANPFTAGDPRRAAWDEAWCREAGSDGMEIPAAWRRTKPAKPNPKKPPPGNGGDDERPGA